MTCRWLSLVGLILIACGGDGGDAVDAGVPAEVPLDQLCERFANVTCRGSRECCAESRYATTQECSTGAIAACEAVLMPEMRLGLRTYSPTAASAEIERLEQAATACTPVVPRLHSTFVPTRQNGDACSGSEYGGYECVDSSAVCRPMIPATLTYVCAERGALGEACTRADQCVSGLSCDGTVCVTPAAAGEPCDPNVCDDGLYCDDGEVLGPESRCEVTLALGAECDALEADQCGATAHCEFQDGIGSRCVPSRESGEECHLDSLCASRLCDSSSDQCVACTSDFDCNRGVCEEGVCDRDGEREHRPLANGERCESSGDCMSERCRMGICEAITIASAFQCLE